MTLTELPATNWHTSDTDTLFGPYAGVATDPRPFAPGHTFPDLTAAINDGRLMDGNDGTGLRMSAIFFGSPSVHYSDSIITYFQLETGVQIDAFCIKARMANPTDEGAVIPFNDLNWAMMTADLSTPLASQNHTRIPPPSSFTFVNGTMTSPTTVYLGFEATTVDLANPTMDGGWWTADVGTGAVDEFNTGNPVAFQIYATRQESDDTTCFDLLELSLLVNTLEVPPPPVPQGRARVFVNRDGATLEDRWVFL